jgi:CubicO group peptidase (beta-lactamase class C family)
MTSAKPLVQGYIAPGFEPVAAAFGELFRDHSEQGAGLVIYRHGQSLLDIYGGYQDRDGQEPWNSDTRANCFSVSKGLVALCVIQLLERGWLDLDAPVADYWDGFEVNGKADISVRQLMSHNSGLSAFHGRLKDSEIFSWDSVVERLEAEEPWWPPGSAQGYSPFVYGWLVGELICRVSGADSFNDYFQQFVAEPLKASCHFGIPLEQQTNIAAMAPLKVTKGAEHQGSGSSIGDMMKADPKGVVNKAFTNPMSLMLGTNSPEWRAAQVPAANGHCTAQGLARIYAALANGGTLDGESVLQTHSLDHCWTELSRGDDKVLGAHLRFGCGFMLSQHDKADCRFGRGVKGFGHPGAGGSLGFADPEFGIGFGYITNRMGQGLLVDPRAQKLIDCLYACL